MIDDPEIRELAVLALKNAFYSQFSSLVNAYVAAAEGLGANDFEHRLQESCSVFGRNGDTDGDEFLNIWVQRGRLSNISCAYDTLAEALEDPKALQVHLRGKRIFVRRKDGWHFTG